LLTQGLSYVNGIETVLSAGTDIVDTLVLLASGHVVTCGMDRLISGSSSVTDTVTLMVGGTVSASGIDSFVGGTGVDTVVLLTGGLFSFNGIDSILASDGVDTLSLLASGAGTGSGAVVITGFAQGTDKIDLALGQLNPDTGTTGTWQLAPGTNVRLDGNTAYIDLDGAGGTTPELTITLVGSVSIAVSDFITAG
jgi:hypothetical protein